jgi:hypothetical protein
VCLKERKLGVSKPRLREKGGSKLPIPAYTAMQENGMSARMLDVLMRGISTRQYAEGCDLIRDPFARTIESLHRRQRSRTRLQLEGEAGTGGI